MLQEPAPGMHSSPGTRHRPSVDTPALDLFPPILAMSRSARIEKYESVCVKLLVLAIYRAIQLVVREWFSISKQQKQRQGILIYTSVEDPTFVRYYG
jgi:hypothetical protein